MSRWILGLALSVLAGCAGHQEVIPETRPAFYEIARGHFEARFPSFQRMLVLTDLGDYRDGHWLICGSVHRDRRYLDDHIEFVLFVNDTEVVRELTGTAAENICDGIARKDAAAKGEFPYQDP